MNNATDFVPMQVSLYVPFEPLPEGGYNAIISESILKDNGFGTNVIAVKFKINEPNTEYHGRIVFIDIRIYDNNPDFEKRKKVIAYATKLLNQICTVSKCIGNSMALDLSRLINKKMHIHLGLYTNTKNRVSNTLYGVGELKENIPAKHMQEKVENLNNNNDFKEAYKDEFTDDDIPFDM